MIPEMNIEAITMKDPINCKAIPEIPLPLVQPFAIRAPISKKNPLKKAKINRLDKALEPSNFPHIGEITERRVPARVEEMKAPKKMPTIIPICNNGFKVGKHEG